MNEKKNCGNCCHWIKYGEYEVGNCRELTEQLFSTRNEDSDKKFNLETKGEIAIDLFDIETKLDFCCSFWTKWK